MVHFPGFARTDLCIQPAVTWFYQIGFPHSEIPGSKPACGSPGLIAACHVLHRLLAPRHPPYALSSLTIKLTQPDSPIGKSTVRVSPARDLSVAHGRLARRCVQASSPFHIALLSSKTCGLHHTELEIRIAHAFFLRLSKIAVPSTVSGWNASAPGGAQCRFGAGAAITSLQIKNPASSAGHVRPFSGAAFTRAASRTDMLEARCATSRCT